MQALLLKVKISPFDRPNMDFLIFSDVVTATSVISEWKVSNETGLVEASYIEKIILTIPQPFRNHNGGTLLFGPDDDLLYFGFGMCFISPSSYSSFSLVSVYEDR